MSLHDDELHDDDLNDAFARSIRNVFAPEAQEQAGDELRCMRLATRATSAFVLNAQDPLRRSLVNSFASEAQPLPHDSALAARIAAGAVLGAAPVSGLPTTSRKGTRRWLGMPLAVSVLLLSSGVLAASAVLVVKVVVPAIVAAPEPAPRRITRRLRPVAAVAAPAPVAQDEAAVVPTAPPSEAPETGAIEVPALVVARPPSSERASAGALFAQANRQRRAGRTSAAAVSYKRLIARFTKAPESALARLALADLATAAGQRGAALAHLNAFLGASQSPALVEEALQRKARVLDSSHRYEEARATWEQLRSRFPRSVYRLEADRYLQAKLPPLQ